MGTLSTVTFYSGFALVRSSADAFPCQGRELFAKLQIPASTSHPWCKWILLKPVFSKYAGNDKNAGFWLYMGTAIKILSIDLDEHSG